MNEKQLTYCANRAAGLAPKESGIDAGYSQVGISVTVSRLESREDVRKEIKRLKAEARGNGPKVKAPIVTVPTAGEPSADEMGKWALKDHYNSPLDLMKDVMNNRLAPKGLRIQCAKDSLMYCHARKEGGKKEERENEAKKAATSKFGVSERPSNVTQLKRAA